MCLVNCEVVMIVLIIGNDLLLICEYVVGIEEYELGFFKGFIDFGEGVLEVVNCELMEEVGFGVECFDYFSKLMMVFFYFLSKMNIVVV